VFAWVSHHVPNPGTDPKTPQLFYAHTVSPRKTECNTATHVDSDVFLVDKPHTSTTVLPILGSHNFRGQGTIAPKFWGTTHIGSHDIE